MKDCKEYLEKQEDGTYALVLRGDLCKESDILVPEGAEAFGYTGIVHTFYKDDFRSYFNENTDGQWDNRSETCIGMKDPVILWQREQDEPFLTPESTLNDQYAEIEEVRQALKDNVNHPSHYTQGKVECIDALESATVGKSGIEAVCVANIIKYLWRYEEKNGLEDIKKANFYLNRLIATLENNNG